MMLLWALFFFFLVKLVISTILENLLCISAQLQPIAEAGYPNAHHSSVLGTVVALVGNALYP